MGPDCAKPVSSRRRILGTLEQLPVFSPILNRLLYSLSKQHVTFVELGALIEKDAVLAGNLLRIVNSALYGLRGEVSAVPHAIALMGLDKFRNTALALAVARMWRRAPAAGNWSAVEFNVHSAATATMADLIVQRVPALYPEGAFTAGLFHDFGKLLIASATPEEYDLLSSMAEGGEEREREALGITHAELGAMAVCHWNLPQPIQKAVRHHHSPDKSDDGLLTPSEIVRAADRCVNALGMAVAPTQPPEVSSPQEALETLGIGDGIPRLLEEFAAEVAVLRPLLEGRPSTVQTPC